MASLTHTGLLAEWGPFARVWKAKKRVSTARVELKARARAPHLALELTA